MKNTLGFLYSFGMGLGEGGIMRVTTVMPEWLAVLFASFLYTVTLMVMAWQGHIFGVVVLSAAYIRGGLWAFWDVPAHKAARITTTVVFGDSGGPLTSREVALALRRFNMEGPPSWARAFGL